MLHHLKRFKLLIKHESIMESFYTFLLIESFWHKLKRFFFFFIKSIPLGFYMKPFLQKEFIFYFSTQLYSCQHVLQYVVTRRLLTGHIKIALTEQQCCQFLPQNNELINIFVVVVVSGINTFHTSSSGWESLTSIVPSVAHDRQ